LDRVNFAPRFRLILAATALATPAISQADALQQQVLAAAKAVTAADFAFTQVNRFERTGTPAKQFVQRYDPRRGASAWTLLKVDDRPPTAKEVADAAKRSTKAKPPSYARIAEWFGAPATRVATTPTSVTYRFASLPRGVVKMGSYDASANTSVEAVVNTAGRIPFVERARFSSNTPFRMFVVAKVERFVITSTHRLLPDGRPVPEATSTEFAGSFMGSAQTMKTRTVYSDVQGVR
jgi:hypothetical protein